MRELVANLNKFLAIIAAVIGIVAIIPIDAVAWWKVDVYPNGGANYSNFINAGGMYHGRTELGGVIRIVQLEYTYFIAGFFVLLGAILLLAGGVKAIKGLIVIGAVLALSAPIVFLIAHGQTTSFLKESEYLGNYSMFFGTSSIPKWDDGGTSNWYLGVGFYLSFATGGLGLLSWKLKWRKAAPWEELASEPEAGSPLQDEIEGEGRPIEGESQADLKIDEK